MQYHLKIKQSYFLWLSKKNNVSANQILALNSRPHIHLCKELNAEFDLRAEPLGNCIVFHSVLQSFCKIQVPSTYVLLNNLSYFFL